MNERTKKKNTYMNLNLIVLDIENWCFNTTVTRTIYKSESDTTMNEMRRNEPNVVTKKWKETNNLTQFFTWIFQFNRWSFRIYFFCLLLFFKLILMLLVVVEIGYWALRLLCVWWECVNFILFFSFVIYLYRAQKQKHLLSIAKTTTARKTKYVWYFTRLFSLGSH